MSINDDKVSFSYNSHMIPRVDVPRFPLVPPTPHSPNVNPRRTRYHTPLHRLCGFPGNLPGMHRYIVRLGMRLQHSLFRPTVGN